MFGLRLAVAMYTALPLPRSWHSRPAPGAAGVTLFWLPSIGAALGALGGLAGAAVLATDGRAGLLAAAIAVAVLAAGSRALHLDGLADTADGLASRAAPADARAIMRRSDVGPFGVLAVVLAVLVDVAAVDLSSGEGRWRPLAVLTVAVATGRLSAVILARQGVPPAPDSAFGALVAGRASTAVIGVQVLLTLGGGYLVGWAAGGRPGLWLVAQVVALALAALAGSRFGAGSEASAVTSSERSSRSPRRSL